MRDDYGSVLRERMKESMSRPAGEWRPLNRIQRPDPFLYWGSWITGVLAAIGTLACVAHEIILRVGK